MDKIAFYQTCIIDVLERYEKIKVYGDGELELELVIDKERNRYLILVIGWNKYKRIHNLIMHIDIKDGKVWIQEDSTDISVVDLLVNKGIPKEDIVLAYLHIEERKQWIYANC